MSITAYNFRDFLPKYVWHMEEPVCEPPAVALYFVSNLARQSSVKVLLSGEGGDEAFGGYQTYRNFLMLEKIKSVFGPAKGLLRLGFQTFDRAGWKRIGKYADLIDPPLSKYYLSRTATPYTIFNKLKQEIYSKEFADTLRIDESDTPTRFLFERVKNQSLLNSMLYLDTKTWLPDDLLLKADKMTMATSVELRVPLLDFQILEFAASLPWKYKVNGSKLKRILKAALDQNIPQEIINRKKTGFPVPYDEWMRKEMKDFVYESLLGANATSDLYFCRKTITKLLQTHQETGKYSKEIFCLLVFELWHRQFVLAPLTII
jgi:asparagine synthase (glutamine-hydrolysing)